MLVPPASRPRFARAFTLVELLVVMGIIGVLLALVAPAMTRLLSARNVGASTYTLAETLDKARAYAMANNTYVWVGFVELNAASAAPQPGTGTIVVAAIASRDGTSVYDPDAPGSLDLAQSQSKTARWQSVDRPQRLANLHLAAASEVQSYDTGANVSANMRRPAADGAAFEVGDPACVSLTPFTVPVGGVSQTFSKVVEFNGQGVARLVTAGATPRAVPGIVEFFVLPTHGASVDHSGDAGAVQVSGLTGATQIYRP